MKLAALRCVWRFLIYSVELIRAFLFYKVDLKPMLLNVCHPKDIYVVETKGVCPGGREVTLTSEKIMPGKTRGKTQIIQNFY